MKNVKIILMATMCLPLLSNGQSQNWTQLDDFDGLGRSGAFSFVINNKGYVGSGQLSNGTLRKDFWEYDPATDTWMQLQDASGIARSYAVGFSIGNKGYMGSGEIGGQGNFISANDFYEYDRSTDTWTIKQSIGLTGRREATAFVIGNKGYVMLGYRDNLNSSDWDETLYEYNPVNNIWTRKADFDVTRLRSSAAGFSVNGKGYVAGGFYATISGPLYRRDIQEYDPVSDSWTLKTTYPSNFELADPVGYSSGSFGYIVGNDILNDGNYVNSLKYDPVNNSFTVIPQYASGANSTFSGLTLCEFAYTVFGTNTKEVWRYFLPDLSISGPSITCTSGNTFSVDNLPGSLSATWAASPANLFAVSSGTGSSATLTAASGTVSGQGTITFTINNSCGIPSVQVQKQVWVGKPTITFVQKQCYDIEAVFKYSATSIPGVTYNWSINNPYLALNTYGNICYVSGDPGNPPQSFILTLQIQNGNCTVTNTKSGTYSDCPGGGRLLSAYPNPASNELTVSYQENSLLPIVATLSEPIQIELVNPKLENVYSVRTKNSTVTIPLEKLPEGIYFLRIVNREGTIQRQIRIKR